MVVWVVLVVSSGVRMRDRVCVFMERYCEGCCYDGFFCEGVIDVLICIGCVVGVVDGYCFCCLGLGF